jgi:hypothetical protein
LLLLALAPGAIRRFACLALLALPLRDLGPLGLGNTLHLAPHGGLVDDASLDRCRLRQRSRPRGEVEAEHQRGADRGVQSDREGGRGRMCTQKLEHTCLTRRPSPADR